MIVAYQGITGAYSEIAARAFFSKCDAFPCATFAEVFIHVCDGRGKADYGVIPVENSLAGSIHENYDLLAKFAPPVIGEIYVHVEHALMALPGTKLRDLTEIRSHPQALAQCSDFLSSLVSTKAVPWYDTAGAALSIKAEKPVGIAAIASEYAAASYGLEILKRRIQNSPDNYTRFLVIARKSSRASGRTSSAKKIAPPLRAGAGEYKTSLTFIPKRNRVGVLHAITGVFASQGVDLTKIESRPDPENPFDYRFYLDATGGAQEPALKKALDELRKMTRDLRVLGSYPKAVVPKTGR
jgi:prephenate dehydratase